MIDTDQHSSRLTVLMFDPLINIWLVSLFMSLNYLLLQCLSIHFIGPYYDPWMTVLMFHTAAAAAAGSCWQINHTWYWSRENTTCSRSLIDGMQQLAFQLTDEHKPHLFTSLSLSLSLSLSPLHSSTKTVRRELRDCFSLAPCHNAMHNVQCVHAV